jgi:hypothetical protein
MQLSGQIAVVIMAFASYQVVHLLCKLYEAKARFPCLLFDLLSSQPSCFASKDVILNLVRRKCIPIQSYGEVRSPCLSHHKHSFLQFSNTWIFTKMFHTSSTQHDLRVSNYFWKPTNNLYCKFSLEVYLLEKSNM